MADMLAWHFLPEDGCVRFGRRSKIRVGQMLKRSPGKLRMCEYGLHASPTVMAALTYAPGPVLCRVRLGGTILEDDSDGLVYRKMVASRRTVLAMKNVSAELQLFACSLVRRTILPDGRKLWDLLEREQSKRTIRVVEQFAAGKATDVDLQEAWYLADVVLRFTNGLSRTVARLARDASLPGDRAVREVIFGIANILASEEYRGGLLWKDAQQKAIQELMVKLDHKMLQVLGLGAWS